MHLESVIFLQQKGHVKFMKIEEILGLYKWKFLKGKHFVVTAFSFKKQNRKKNILSRFPLSNLFVKRPILCKLLLI